MNDDEFRTLTAAELRELREHGRAHCACGEWVPLNDRAALSEHRDHTEADHTRREGRGGDEGER